MMMQMLAAGGIALLSDSQREADEDNPKGYYEYEPVKSMQSDQSWVPRARGKAVKVIHALLTQLPPTQRYRVIFMTRRLDEVLRSQTRMLNRSGRKGGNISESELSRAFNAQLESVDRLLHESDHFQVLNIDYNQTLASPGETASAVSQFLGGVAETEAMVAVVDGDLYRQRSNRR